MAWPLVRRQESLINDLLQLPAPTTLEGQAVPFANGATVAGVEQLRKPRLWRDPGRGGGCAGAERHNLIDQ